MARASKGMETGRALLLGVLVIVGTIGGMFLIGGSEEPETAPKKHANDDDVLEVTPLMNAGALASASWRKGAPAQAEAAARAKEDDGTVSLLSEVEFSEDGSKKAKSSLEKVVGDIHGLGVYVAPAEEKDEAPAPSPAGSKRR